MSTPCNIQQLRNLHYKFLHSTRISHDSLYNVHEIAYDVPAYVRKIITYPDLIIICGLQEVIDEFNNVMMLTREGQLLSYDTIFQLGDFYVSPLVFQHLLFNERPCIPAIFLIHERKFTETHEELFRECVKAFTFLKNKKELIPIVTDREKAIVAALKNQLPSLKLVYCWNHILRDIQLWCRKHRGKAVDVAIYSDDIYHLFQSMDNQQYESALIEYKAKWDPVFLQYYMDEIHPEVAISIGRWVLEEYGIYNPYCGVTNNQSESLNKLVNL